MCPGKTSTVVIYLTDVEVPANEMQHFISKVWSHAERLDAEVYALAKSYIMAHHPKVIYIDLKIPTNIPIPENMKVIWETSSFGRHD